MISRPPRFSPAAVSRQRSGLKSQPPGIRGESEQMKTTKEINKEWSAYEQSVAKCYIANYGIIFLDSFDRPIDNEYEAEELYNNLK